MTTSFRLPDLGEGVHEAEILALPVSIGQAVAEGDIIMEIETDKAAVEIPSPYTGTVSEILVKIGDMAIVGDVLMIFTTDTAQQPRQESGGTTTEQNISSREQKRRPVPASPSTRRLARELAIDLHAVTPTGSGGIVTKEDVETHAGKKAVPKSTITTQVIPEKLETPDTTPLTSISGLRALPDFSKWGEIERLPFRSVRRATAKQMTNSWTQIPHVHSQDNVDITKLEDISAKTQEGNRSGRRQADHDALCHQSGGHRPEELSLFQCES